MTEPLSFAKAHLTEEEIAAVTVVLTLALVAAGVVAYRRLAARQAAEQE